MNILIGCEESQTVCKAFRGKGHYAFSCDLLECSGGHTEWHIKKDILEIGKWKWDDDAEDKFWDIIISFPPCTDLAVSGAKWFQKKRLSGEQELSINFFIDVWELSDAVENPIGIMSGGKYIQKWFPVAWERINDIKFPLRPSQIIQPWQFGHGETKATCLWLKELPLLQPTKIVSGREQKIWRLPPSSDRSILRSKTYIDIAKAMADQWDHKIN